jgi:hypothetical protein
VVGAIEHAYAAGLFDGRGAIEIAKAERELPQYWLLVRLTNVDARMAESMQQTFGGSLTRRADPRPARRAGGDWRLRGAQAAAFLALIRPYLRIKGEQAALALEFQATLDRRRRTPEVNALRESYRSRLAWLRTPSDRQRGPPSRATPSHPPA